MSDTDEKPYVVNSPTFTGAIAALVAQFKARNYPGVGEFSCVCHDGTTVAIKIEAKKPRAKKRAA
jgi:hypothetical protein